MARTRARRTLIITTSGGNGNIQAANAKEEEILALDPNEIIIKKDLMLDWGLKMVSVPGVGWYNKTQIEGKVFWQQFLFNIMCLADIFFWPKIFLSVLLTLFYEKIDRVIDVQPVAISAIVKAIRIYCKYTKKKILLEQVFVDLPTVRNTHNLKNIRTLTKEDKKHIKVYTQEPLLENEESEEEFWRKNCKIGLESICHVDYPVRLCFKKVRFAQPEMATEIEIRTKSQKEKEFITQIASRGGDFFKERDLNLFFDIKANDRVYTVLLGSQPAREATFNYVSNFMEAAAKLFSTEKNYRVFVFCSDFSDVKNTIYSRLRKLVLSKVQENIAIIPMSFQQEDVIAKLYQRSDLTITRSGGQTIMELIETSKNTNWIHSEISHAQESISEKQLLKGMPSWEAGNALYFASKKKCKIVTPELLVPFLQKHAELL